MERNLVHEKSQKLHPSFEGTRENLILVQISKQDPKMDRINRLLAIGAVMTICAAVSAQDLKFEDYFSPQTSESVAPDAEGFIRRWTLLEPISKPNRSNTVFTDRYIRAAFDTLYFKGQKTVLPKDGEKVKVTMPVEAPVDMTQGRPDRFAPPVINTVKARLSWHAVDSKLYNVKLFRFASGLKKQVYGNIFMAVTLIDCPEDLVDVRLSAGSNSASQWWIDGVEAVILSGDRRMVADDAASPRLTLKKGPHVIRGAVINGPGMSDFCIRFIDAQGNPVKNYSIIRIH